MAGPEVATVGDPIGSVIALSDMRQGAGEICDHAASLSEYLPHHP
jgi:hypothetical protein